MGLAQTEILYLWPLHRKNWSCNRSQIHLWLNRKIRRRHRPQIHLRLNRKNMSQCYRMKEKEQTRALLPEAEVSQNYYCIYVVEPSFFAENCITRCIPCIWHFFSILTCQYIRPVNSCIGTAFMIVLIAFFALFAIMISIFPTSAFLAVWIECPYGIYNICFTVKHHDDTHIIVFKDTNHTTTGTFKE